jgi:hypothetical protein
LCRLLFCQSVETERAQKTVNLHGLAGR